MATRRGEMESLFRANELEHDVKNLNREFKIEIRKFVNRAGADLADRGTWPVQSPRTTSPGPV